MCNLLMYLQRCFVALEQIVRLRQIWVPKVASVKKKEMIKYIINKDKYLKVTLTNNSINGIKSWPFFLWAKIRNI